jgi:SNF2-related domain/Domain of unknown function (DUF3883)
MTFETGQRLHIPDRGLPEWVTVDNAYLGPAGWKLYVKHSDVPDGALRSVDLTEDEAKGVTVLTNDGAADSARVLAGLWTQWMGAAGANASSSVLASTPLRPYAHQSNAVYGAMLPQPMLRFLLADEPGTGKTIMAALYLREMQKLGLVSRALVVCPAGLVTKWQADYERFFGGELRRITNETIQQHGLAAPHDMWVVSLELAAMNPAVQEAIRPDRAGWDIVVFDEAHRLTPTAETFHQVGRLLAKNTPRALLMTATPHRGSEWLFRHLLHLVDPEVYPDPGNDPKAEFRPIKPGPVHFLRRMKEDLVDYDGKRRLFRARTAHNEMIPGDVLATLLDSFVTAANQLSGQMFDSLSLVAELAGLGEGRLSGLLSDTYGDDPDKRDAALTAVKAITSAQLRGEADKRRRAEAALASTVDVAAALQRLNNDMLERINPAIVEAYLSRLSEAKVIAFQRWASGEGILKLASPTGALPPELGGNGALVATSGGALKGAQEGGATLTTVTSLGPGEPGFHALVRHARQQLSPDIFRGGVASDPTCIVDYDLMAFEGELREGDGQRSAPWSTLIQVDATGARKVAWENLANLIPSAGVDGQMHPSRALDAQARAEQLANEEQTKRRNAVRTWLTSAEREVRDLPGKISRDIGDRAKRLEVRGQLEHTVKRRLIELRRMTEVAIINVRLVAHIHVQAEGIPPEPTEKDSERISMRRVHDELVADQWAVADVHQEGRGYDLYATKGQAQRCVEVKGVWSSAASTGIRMTGKEILIATQQRADFWLYVIDNCANGEGNVFGVYRDPVLTFDGLIKQDAIFTVPGSALTAARDQGASA